MAKSHLDLIESLVRDINRDPGGLTFVIIQLIADDEFWKEGKNA